MIARTIAKVWAPALLLVAFLRLASYGLSVWTALAGCAPGFAACSTTAAPAEPAPYQPAWPVPARRSPSRATWSSSGSTGLAG